MNNIKPGVKILMAFIIMLGMLSCSKTNDSYKKFVGDGEIPYSARPDSLKAQGGVNRVMLSWLFTSDPNIRKYKITWNNGKDSIVRDFVRTAGVDTVRELITNLPEGTYIFDVYTYDAKGNSSVKSEVVARAYGDVYYSSLLPRTFRTTTRTQKDMLVSWAPPIDDVVYTRISYTDLLGNAQTLYAKKSDTYSILPLFPFGGSFTYQSFYMPDTTSLDTLSSPAVTQAFKVTYFTDWDKYNLIWGFDEELAVRMNSTGDLYAMSYNGNSNTFNTSGMTLFGNGWGSFTYIIPLNDGGNLMTVSMPSGVLRDYKYYHPAYPGNYWGQKQAFLLDEPASEVLAWNLIFGAKRIFFVRNSQTKVVKYYVSVKDASWPNIVGLKTPTPLTGVDWSKYNALVGLTDLDYLYGRTADGNLYRLAVNFTNNTISSETLVATGWDKYRLINSYGNILLAAEGKNLWIVKVKDDGTLDVPTPASYTEEPL